MAIWTRGTVDQREAMVLQWMSGRYTAAEVAARWETTRTTVYAWTARYRAAGRRGLADRPPIAMHCPHKTAAAIEAPILALRARYGWGPKKLYARLCEQHPDTPWPRASTIGDILTRHGQVTRRPRRPPVSTPFRRKFDPVVAGDLMTVDFKGQFKTDDGRYCYPLTIMERQSRVLLACDALPSTAYLGVWPIFERVFRTYGLPLAVQSDNGVPFAAASLARVSTLSVQLMKLGIQPVLNDLGHPEQNGAHERMHRTLKAETARPPAGDARAQQQRFDAFRTIYNEERPHEALGQTPPARHFQQTTRPYPSHPPRIAYPGHMEVRTVCCRGLIKFQRQRLFLTSALIGERVALAPIDDGVWALYFGRFELARLDERTRTWQ